MAGSQGDAFCGFWLRYDRLENEDQHVFDISSETEQMLFSYMDMPENGRQEIGYNFKSGSSLGDVAQNIKVTDEGDEVDIKGTLYLLEEDQTIQEQGYEEIWLQGDVVQSFRNNYIEWPEGTDQEGMLRSGQTVIVYIPQDQIVQHGQELTEMEIGRAHV